jgi:hypothetical protein
MADAASIKAGLLATFRDFEVAGVPAAGLNEPDKAAIRTWLAALVDLAAVAGTTKVVETVADLASLSPSEVGERAEVRADPAGDVVDGNGVYGWSGSAWVWISDLVPASVLDGVAADADRAETAAASALNRVAYIAPLATRTPIQGLRERFTRDATVSGRHGGDPGTFSSVANVDSAYLRSNYGYPNALGIYGKTTDVAGASQPRGGFSATADELVEMGVTPDDTTPPKIDARGMILLQDGGDRNQTAASSNNGSGQMYVILRYAGAGAALTPEPNPATDVVWTGTGTAPSASGSISHPSAVADARFAGSTATMSFTAGVKKQYLRSNVPVPATFNSQDLTGVIVYFIGLTINAGISRLDVMADVVPGGTVSGTASYLNLPEDQPEAGLSYDGAADVVAVSDGSQFRYVRTRFEDRALVQRFEVDIAPTDNNGLWDHEGARLVDADLDMGLFPSLWAVTPSPSEDAIYGGGDVTEPYRINGQWLAGGHGLPCRNLTITAHSMRVGSVWSDGVREWVVATVPDANTVQVVSQPGGTDAVWSFYTGAMNGTTLTHVSGNLTTTDRTVSADASGQVWPFVRSRSVEIMLDDQDAEPEGLYTGSVLRFRERYVLPNPKKAVEYIIANVGDADNSIIHEDIDGQIEFGVVHEIDWTGNVRGVLTAYDLIGYDPVQWNAAQPKKLGINGGQTLEVFVPGSLAIGADDFEAGVDVTVAPASEFEFTAAQRADPAVPVTTAVYIASLAGAPRLGMFTTLDDTMGQGLPATRVSQATDLRITTSLKTYLYAGDLNTATGAGTLHEAAGITGFFDPSLDPDLTWNFVVRKSAGWRQIARAPGALADHWVAVDKRFIGQPVTLVRGGAVATLKSSIVSARGVLVNWTARGEVEIAIG